MDWWRPDTSGRRAGRRPDRTRRTHHATRIASRIWDRRKRRMRTDTRRTMRCWRGEGLFSLLTSLVIVVSDPGADCATETPFPKKSLKRTRWSSCELNEGVDALTGTAEMGLYIDM